MSGVEFAARLAGVPQELIEEIKKAAPKAAELLNLLKANQDFILRAQNLFFEAEKEVMALLPTAMDLVKYIQTLTPPQTDNPTT